MPDKPTLRIAERAQKQITDIWQYLATEASVAIADRIYDEIRTALKRLPDAPEQWPSRDYIRPHYRRVLVSTWVIYYRYVPGSDVIDVVAVLHGRMDADRHLPTGEDHS